MKPKILSFVANSNKLLALKSKSHPDYGPSEWFVVTGFVEPGETHEDAVRREVLEETSLIAMNILPLNWGSIYEWKGESCKELNFMCFVKPGDVVLNEEHIEYEWLEIGGFIERIKWDDDKELLRKVLEKALNKKQYLKKQKIKDHREHG